MGIRSVAALCEDAPNVCPHRVKVHYERDQDEILAWCNEHLGRSLMDSRRSWDEYYLPDGRWYRIGCTYQFRNQNEAFWFKMVWG